jgi:hypothetical protein
MPDGSIMAKINAGLIGFLSTSDRPKLAASHPAG